MIFWKDALCIFPKNRHYLVKNSSDEEIKMKPVGMGTRCRSWRSASLDRRIALQRYSGLKLKMFNLLSHSRQSRWEPGTFGQSSSSSQSRWSDPPMNWHEFLPNDFKPSHIALIISGCRYFTCTSSCNYLPYQHTGYVITSSCANLIAESSEMISDLIALKSLGRN